jgi:hypothetical protein
MKKTYLKIAFWLAVAGYLAIQWLITSARLPANFWSLPFADKWIFVKLLFAPKPATSPFE